MHTQNTEYPIDAEMRVILDAITGLAEDAEKTFAFMTGASQFRTKIIEPIGRSLEGGKLLTSAAPVVFEIIDRLRSGKTRAAAKKLVSVVLTDEPIHAKYVAAFPGLSDPEIDALYDVALARRDEFLPRVARAFQDAKTDAMIASAEPLPLRTTVPAAPSVSHRKLPNKADRRYLSALKDVAAAGVETAGKVVRDADVAYRTFNDLIDYIERNRIEPREQLGWAFRARDVGDIFWEGCAIWGLVGIKHFRIEKEGPEHDAYWKAVDDLERRAGTALCRSRDIELKDAVEPCSWDRRPIPVTKEIAAFLHIVRATVIEAKASLGDLIATVPLASDVLADTVDNAIRNRRIEPNSLLELLVEKREAWEYGEIVDAIAFALGFAGRKQIGDLNAISAGLLKTPDDDAAEEAAWRELMAKISDARRTLFLRACRTLGDLKSGAAHRVTGYRAGASATGSRAVAGEFTGGAAGKRNVAPGGDVPAPIVAASTSPVAARGVTRR